MIGALSERFRMVLIEMNVNFTMLVLVGCCLLSLVTIATSGLGTTRNIQEIFIGRCLEYLEVRPSDLNTPNVTNCTDLWFKFSSAWIHKDPNTIRESDYLSFFDGVKQTNIKKILFWSGTYDIAHEYSRHVSYYVTLEDTFLGYLVNGLTWCGVQCSNCPGINYTSCPDNLHNEAGRAFWGGASRTFATSLKEYGHVQLMLNGSNPDRAAFNPESFFSLYELPNLPKSSMITVLVVHDIEKPIIETCDTGSLLILKHKIESLGFEYNCVDNPTAVVHLLCADIPLDSRCTFEYDRYTNATSLLGNTYFTNLILYLVALTIAIYFIR